MRLLGGVVAATLAIAAGCCACDCRSERMSPNISVFAQYVRGVADQRGVSLKVAAERLHELGVCGFDTAYDDPALGELAGTCLRPVNLYGWMNFLGDDFGRAKAEAFVTTAERHGVPRIMAIPDSFTKGGDEESEFLRIVEGMRWLVAFAKTHGITVMIEDFGGDPKNPCNQMRYMKRFLDEIPELRLALDSGNFYYARRDEDILELMRYAGDRIEHVHLKDQLPSDHRTYAVLGLGGVPNAEIVRHVASKGYCGWYTLENTVKDADVYMETVRQIAVLKVWHNEAIKK